MKIHQYIFVCLTLLLFSCDKGNEGPSENITGLEKLDQIDFSRSAIQSIAVDELSNVWVGTQSGLFLLQDEVWYQHPSFSGSSVTSLFANTNEILIATNYGAFTLSTTTDGFSISDSISKEILGGTSNEMTAFEYGLFDHKWIGSDDGLAFFDGTQWNRNEAIRNNLGGISNISSMAFRSDDCFFGTYGKYLYHISYQNSSDVDAISGASQMLGGAEDEESNFNGALTSDTIFCVFAGSDNSIWFGSTLGLTRNKGKTNSYNGDFEYFLKGQRVHSVLETADGKLWAGTENGLSCRNGSDWLNYTVSDGLPGNFILTLAIADDLSIWVGTNKGLAHYADGVFTNY
ncbi:MAG: two-component regulator propeller domain-containing protein [Prolixibacteraceae bacterium]